MLNRFECIKKNNVILKYFKKYCMHVNFKKGTIIFLNLKGMGDYFAPVAPEGDIKMATTAIEYQWDPIQ